MAAAVKNDRVYTIILAAGSASRFGGDKQTAVFEGSTLVERACSVAADVSGSNTVLVTGHNWQTVRDACRPMSGSFVINEDYASGMGSSLALAVRGIRHCAAAVLVMLVDQPLVTATHLRALISAWSGEQHEIVASRYGDTTGVPALFGAGCFDSLAELSGDAGARTLLQGSGFDVKSVRFENAAADVDTPDDLSRLGNNVRS